MNVVKFFITLILVLFIVVFVMNQSISSYVEQKYHISYYPQNDVLKEANEVRVKLEKVRDVFIHEPIEEFTQEKAQEDNEESLNEDNTTIQENKILNIQDENLNNEENNFTNKEVFTDENASFSNNAKLEVKNTEEFLLIGDSLMQFVAIALHKDLKDLGIKSTDLSKQSTGLSYQSYFNWAKTTQDAFDKNSNIKYLVVLLGANDPWDIKKGRSLIKFGSPTWIELYSQRVQEIIDIAKKNHAKVLWFEIPPVKKDSLNEKISLLNQIYKQEMIKNGEIFIDTKSFFSKNGEFSSYIKNENNKSIKMRADDGIHFTSSGAKAMSKLLLNHIVKYNNAQ